MFHALLALTLAAHAAVLVVRLAALVRYGDLIPQPIEGPGLYAMWKVQHGYALYEWPTRPYFALTLYNFLFYETYARLLAIARVPIAQLPIAAKLLTLPFAVAGAIAFVAAARALLRRLGVTGHRLFLVAAASLVWLGAGVVGPWAMAARPDVAAAALAVAALAIVVRTLDREAPAQLAAAGTIFFLAWAFKQSTVGILAGVCMFELLVERRWRRVLLLAGPFAALCALTVALGGPAYRFNLLTAPRLSGGMVPWMAVYWYRQIVLPNLPIWIAVAAGLAHWGRARRADASPWRDPALTLLVCTMATSFALNLVLLAKPGSAVNHTFESWFVSALFAIASFLLLAQASPASARRSYLAAPVLMLAPLAAAILLLVRGRGAPDRLTVATADEYARRAAIATRLASLPKPLFVDDEILGQPWFANDDRYPAVVLDHVFYSAAGEAGYLERKGVLSLIDDRYFAALVVQQPPWLWTREATAAGYVRAGIAGRTGDGDELVILLRSDAAPRRPVQMRRPTSRRMP